MKHLPLHITLRICMTITLLWLSATTRAQNNPYKIDDRLYPLYVRATNHRKDTLGVLVADTMRQRAIAWGDKKAEILAMIIPLQYHSEHNCGYEFLAQLGKGVREKSIKYDYLQYYYYVSSLLVNYLVKNKEETKALDLLRKDIEFAKKHEHPYGVLSGYTLLGNIHTGRYELIRALSYYRQALDYVKANMQEKQRAVVYVRICQTLCLLYRFDEAKKIAEQGLAYAYSDRIRGTLLWYKTLACYMTLDRNFEKSWLESSKYDIRQLDMLRYHANLLAFIGYVVNTEANKPHAAEKKERFMKSYQNDYFVKYLEQMFYLRYPEASQLMDELVPYALTISKDNVFDGMMELYGDVMEREANLVNQRAANVQARLQLEHAQLELHNAELELEHNENIRHYAQAKADRNKLLYDNQKLKISEMRDSLGSHRYLQELQKRRYYVESAILDISWKLIVLFIVLALVYLWRHQKMEKRLKELAGKLQKTITEYHVMNNQAQEADHKKTQFIQTMSHEVRTPLNSIVGFSQVLSEMGDVMSKEEKDDITSRITQNSEMLSTLINDILDLTSIESGKYEMRQEPVAVNALCRKALENIRHRLAPGVKLSFHTDLKDSEEAVTDAARTEQVLVNLLTNAAKNTSEGSITLECSSNQHPGQLTFTVTDTGVGVPKEKMKEIFERFSKVDTFKQGSGLGLEICRVISTRLGGYVDIDPDYSGGARFWFSIAFKRP